jgi:hypothetical protein
MILTGIRASGARSWIIGSALAATLMSLVGGGADWQMSGDDLTNDPNQPQETLIDVGNVATLNPAWMFKTRGSVSATPLVNGGYVYFADWGGGLHNGVCARSGHGQDPVVLRVGRFGGLRSGDCGWHGLLGIGLRTSELPDCAPVGWQRHVLRVQTRGASAHLAVKRSEVRRS